MCPPRPCATCPPACEPGAGNAEHGASDKHRTTTLAIDAGDEQTFVKRSLAPFGQKRTEARIGDWVDDKAFIGKTNDDGTGLTHIGAREYDPTTGTFLSVDPLLETDAPQTLNGYSYGAQKPYTYTDPTGEGLACGGAGGSDVDCPDRPDGTEGNGRPQEAVYYSKPAPPHPCNGPSCKRSGEDVQPKGDGGKKQKRMPQNGPYGSRLQADAVADVIRREIKLSASRE